MTISAVIPTRHDFTGNDVNESFSYTIKISNQTHIKLVHTDTDGVENALADPLVVDVDYTVNGVGDAGGGTVDFPKGGSVYSTLASGEKLSILYVFPIEQELDLPNLGRMFNESVEDQLDFMTVLHNQSQEKFDRSIKLVEGSTLTDIAWPEGADAAARKNKLVAWNDDSDALELASSIGTFRGNWATSTAYTARDTVKDTSNNNIYQANTTHTSTGSQPISSNADVAKWDLIVDAAAATAAAEAVAYKYTFDDSVSMADPGTGDIRLDNATIGSVTNIAIDALSADTGNPDVSDFIASWDDGTNITHEGYITIRKVGTPATFAVYSLTGAVVDNTGWLQLPVTHVASNGSLTAADELYVSFARSGNRGNDAGLDMTFESLTTDVDQGAGKTWLNNATPASATVFYMDDEDANGADINSWVDSWDDSNSTVKGQIELSKQSDPAVFALYNVTGAVTDASGYSKVAVTYVTGAGSFTDADPVNVAFTRGGNKGDTGATGGGLADVVDDTTPQLGGNLDVNGKDITSPDGTDLIDIVDGAIDIQTNSSSRLDFSDSGVRLGGANARVTTVLDEDAMGSDSATALATQQSIKKYVDDNASAITLGTPQASTSGTAIDFTSIPAGTKKITIMFNGVSTNGTEGFLVQIGDSGGVETSDYVAAVQQGAVQANSTTGFLVTGDSAMAGEYRGSIILTLENSANFTWTSQSIIHRASSSVWSASGGKSLSAELDRVRITTTGTPDTFDLGEINIQFE